MGKIRDLKGLIGRVEFGFKRETGVQFEVEGLSVILCLILIERFAKILQCTI